MAEKIALVTLSDYISYVNSDFFNLRNTSSISVVDDFEYLNYNSLYKYKDILLKNCITVTLTPKELKQYRFRPRLLSKMIYGTENLFYLLLILNNVTVERFNIREIKLLSIADRSIIEDIINKEKSMGNI